MCVCTCVCMCVSLCGQSDIYSLFMNMCECLPKTYRSNKGHFTVCGCLCVYTSKTHTHWTLPTYAMSLACVLRSSATWLSGQTAPNIHTIQILNCTQVLESFERRYWWYRIQPQHRRFFWFQLALRSDNFSSSWLEHWEHISDHGERNLKFSPV